MCVDMGQFGTSGQLVVEHSLLGMLPLLVQCCAALVATVKVVVAEDTAACRQCRDEMRQSLGLGTLGMASYEA